MKRITIIARSASTAAWAVALAVALLLAACLLASPALAAEGSCPNEARRAEQSSTYLTNCRAYEQVTPVEKDSGEPEAVLQALNEREMFAPIDGAFAALDGARMAWDSEDPGLSGPNSDSLGLDYMSTRGAEGWSTEATVPPQSLDTGLVCPEFAGIVGWSRNFTKRILAEGASQKFSSSFTSGEKSFFQEEGCGHAEPALREADGAEIKEPAGFQNLFMRDNQTGSYQLVNVTPAGVPTPTPTREFQTYYQPDFLAGSADLEHVAFEEELPLTKEAEELSPAVEAACKEQPKGRACWEGHDDLYEWSEGQQPAVRLVTVLPGGKPVDGALAGSTRNSLETKSLPRNVADYRHAVSADGSRIFFEAEGNLYVRENGGQPPSAIAPGSTAVNGEQCTEPEKACTIQLDLPGKGAPGSGGGGKWLGANTEGTKVFFTDEASGGLTSTTQTGSGANLYEYELPSAPDTTGTLVDLSPATKAEVLGVSDTSEDGSYVYFVASGKLTGKDKVAGRSPEESEPSQGADNLYVNHEGAITFIATLSSEDLCDWTSDTGCNLKEPGNPEQTGLTGRVSGNGLYLAFNSVNGLTGYNNAGPGCVEVRTGGQHYVAGSCEEIFLYEAEGNHLACVSCNPNGVPSADGAVIDWPAGPDRDSTIIRNAYPQRNVSDAGQVFFETPEALSPQQDTNGLRDVYEYEHGSLHLMSSGTSTAPSFFLDATPSGSDVFFATAQKLLPRDTESTYNIYDTRVGGGFPEPAASGPPCSGESCREAVVTAPTFATPGSASFVGAGNLTAPRSTLPKPRTAAQIKVEKLARALKACRARKNRHKWAVCESRARKQYGHSSNAKKSARANRRDKKS
ncbi:MAG TPA: hypothetical protein VHS55_00170 [Solirubrobacteraceae bacterium]|jgi:hypothetical protein|nr:hypothetical protein [Solirubrobacteraceae bacterium]